ncbi:hypothetical protein ACM41_11730 [Bradyrhizobium sp. CCBAU 21362]|nr:hypothetical protein [Bradyrhizobium sp. CCBAU 21362]
MASRRRKSSKTIQIQGCFQQMNGRLFGKDGAMSSHDERRRNGVGEISRLLRDAASSALIAPGFATFSMARLRQAQGHTLCAA